MELKAGVGTAGLRPELLLGLIIAQTVYKEYSVPFVVTEITGAEHSVGSLHYLGLAADLRSRDIPKAVFNALVSVLRRRLGDDFEVLVESDHLHLQYRPKKNR